MAKPADPPPDLHPWSKSGRRCRSEPMHGIKCSHDPGATIATAGEEAARRMQLHSHWVLVKRWRKHKSQAERPAGCKKGAPDKFSLDEVAEGGLANNRYRGATFFHPLLHPLRLVLRKEV